MSTGFVARAHERFADVLAAAGFDEAMAAALHAEDVLCADEIAVNLVNDIEPDGQPANGRPHVITVRILDTRLVWYRAIAAGTACKIAQLGVFTGWRGVLVRDDYAGWFQFDAQLARRRNRPDRLSAMAAVWLAVGLGVWRVGRGRSVGWRGRAGFLVRRGVG